METRISRSLLDAIRAEAAAAEPREACGLLFGSKDEITGWKAAENVAETPETHFEIEPGMLIAALRDERRGGRRLAGYWHSHPSGECKPSATDALMAAGDDRLWLIVAGETAGLWRAVRGPLEQRFAAVRLVETR